MNPLQAARYILNEPLTVVSQPDPGVILLCVEADVDPTSLINAAQNAEKYCNGAQIIEIRRHKDMRLCKHSDNLCKHAQEGEHHIRCRLSDRIHNVHYAGKAPSVLAPDWCELCEKAWCRRDDLWCKHLDSAELKCTVSRQHIMVPHAGDIEAPSWCELQVKAKAGEAKEENTPDMYIDPDSPEEKAKRLGVTRDKAIVTFTDASGRVIRYGSDLEARDAYHEAKHDQGKLQWHLLPWRACEAVVRVLMHGMRAEGYRKHGWIDVPDGKERYLDAAMRHLIAHHKGEILDPKSGLPHVAHAACNCLFLIALHEDEE